MAEQSDVAVARSYLFGLRGKNINYAIATIAGTGYFLFGYDQGVMGT